jgi:hypothetical protein
MHRLLVAISVFAVFPLLLAQQTLNNDSVIKMVKMGFPEDMIVNAINRSPGAYDTSANGLTALKNAGVGDKEVAAMVAKGTAPVTPPPPNAPAQATPSQDVPPPAASTPLAPAPNSSTNGSSGSTTTTPRPLRAVSERLGIVPSYLATFPESFLANFRKPYQLREDGAVQIDPLQQLCGVHLNVARTPVRIHG